VGAEPPHTPPRVIRAALGRHGRNVLLPCLLWLSGCTRLADDRWNTGEGRADRESIAGARIDTGPLGLIGDVLRGADGRLYVMDVREKRLTVIAPGAGPRRVLGRAGHGPGEFIDPVALAEDGGTLYVLDRGTQRLETYRTGPNGVSHAGSLALDFVPEDLCATGSRVFILGPRGGYLLHEISARDGRVLRSLAREPASMDPMLSAFHGAGFVECGPGDELTVLPLLRPMLSRYSARTGRILGQIRIPGYRATRVRRADGAVIYQAPRGGIADHAASLVRQPDGRMLVQVGPVQRGATRFEFTSLRSFVISWADDTVAELTPALPRIVAIHGDTAFGVHTDPVPALRRFSFFTGKAGVQGSNRSSIIHQGGAHDHPP
jgi:hypothetical protein